MQYIVERVKVIKETKIGIVETEIEIEDFEELLYRGGMDSVILWNGPVREESPIQYECINALKKCPFCGGPATIEAITDEDYMVYCEDCGVVRSGYGTAIQAIRYWNNRYVEKE